MPLIRKETGDILGIDPGQRGAIARLTPSRQVVDIWIIPTADKDGKIVDLQALARIFRQNTNVARAYLEQVAAYPGQGVSSTFKFGRNYGHLEAMLAAFGIPFVLVTPAKWAKTMHAGIERTGEPKDRSRIAAGRLFPDVDLRKSARALVPHDGKVDALMLAEYGRRDIYGADGQT